MIQACNRCGGPMPMCGGIYCASCRPIVAEEARNSKSARQLAALKANVTMRLMAETKPAPVDNERVIPVNVPIPVLADAAADQLAKAWGVRKRR